MQSSAIGLVETDMALCSDLLTNSSRLLPVFDEALRCAQARVLECHAYKEKMKLKPFAHVRLHSIPICREITKMNVSSIRSKDIGSFVSLSGTVIRTGLVQMRDSEREGECVKCLHRFRVLSDMQNGNCMELPKCCPSNLEAGPALCKKSCKSKEFR